MARWNEAFGWALVVLGCGLLSAGCGSNKADGAGGGSGTAGAGGSAGAGGQTACTTLPPASGDAKFDELVQNLVKAEINPGIGTAVAVYADGKLHEAVYGSKSPTSCDPVTTTSRFNGVRLADVVTALAALRVEEKGKIDLDQPVRTYVPDLKLDAASEKWAPELTLRSLLSWSSGYYPIYWWPEDPGGCPKEFKAVGGEPGPNTLAEFFSKFAAPIYHEPGTEWMYGSPGFPLVARALEEAESKPFADIVKAEVADPSGLGLTYDPAVYKNGDLAQPTTALSNCELVWPNRGLYLDVQDLGKLLQSLASGGDSVVSKTEVSSLEKGGGLPATPDAGMSSLGFYATPLPGLGTLVERTGHDGQYAAGMFLVIPERHFGFAALANRVYGGNNYRIELAMFNTYFPGVKLQYDHSTDPATWTEYAGTYQRDDGAQAVIKVDTAKGTMSATLADGTVQMTPSGIQAYMSTGGLKDSKDPDYFKLSTSTFAGGNIVRFYRDTSGVPDALGFLRGDGGENSHPFIRVP